MKLHYDTLTTPAGPLTVVCGEDLRLKAVFFGTHENAPEALVSKEWIKSPACVAPAVRLLKSYLAGKPEKPLSEPAPEGTPFQKKVWKALLEIPYGESRTYQQIAEVVGSAPRAVGGAIGANPLAILVPCHRVVASDGSLSGFAWGVEKKVWLRNHEGIPVPGPKTE